MRETKYSYYQHKYSKSLISPPFTLQFEKLHGATPPRSQTDRADRSNHP